MPRKLRLFDLKCIVFSNLISICVLMLSSCKAPEPGNLEWTQNPLNAGDIPYGSMKSIEFSFSNPGGQTARIRGVYPGCDCTIIDSFTTGDIAPGEHGKVYIHYDTHKGIIGPLRKNLFVVSSGTRDSVSTLYYTGVVTGTK